MKLVFPARPIRRVDIAVGGLVGLWILSGFIVLVWLAFTHSVRPGTSLFPFVSLLGILLLAASNACVGTILGRVWGFRWMAGLMVVLVLGFSFQLLALKRPIAPWHPFEWGSVLAVLAYSLFRLGALRREARRLSREKAS